MALPLSVEEWPALPSAKPLVRQTFNDLVAKHLVSSGLPPATPTVASDTSLQEDHTVVGEESQRWADLASDSDSDLRLSSCMHGEEVMAKKSSPRWGDLSDSDSEVDLVAVSMRQPSNSPGLGLECGDDATASQADTRICASVSCRKTLKHSDSKPTYHPSLQSMDVHDMEIARLVHENARLASENQRLREKAERSLQGSRAVALNPRSATSAVSPSWTKKAAKVDPDFPKAQPSSPPGMWMVPVVFWMDQSSQDQAATPSLAPKSSLARAAKASALLQLHTVQTVGAQKAAIPAQELGCAHIEQLSMSW
eukprot:CAMPEP_0115284758 /NCGR_PEP_ID=MMETSP0270-20121206/61067_1 /TAXON_ID=71861 /ORGANISM="Scrippsiella trochoidea, Strain CCMP3099" /LENGTH=309 /DNA_ID=CAMNT_0002701733 /DNA_START=77 /DNA_END=1004 /DNA_ORIENTATION=-